jgi:hypothetical protein
MVNGSECTLGSDCILGMISSGEDFGTCRSDGGHLGIALLIFLSVPFFFLSSSFFSFFLKSRIHMLNTLIITKQDQFNWLLNRRMIELASHASNVPIGAKKFWG